jgi:hypothetical protein
MTGGCNSTPTTKDTYQGSPTPPKATSVNTTTAATTTPSSTTSASTTTASTSVTPASKAPATSSSASKKTKGSTKTAAPKTVTKTKVVVHVHTKTVVKKVNVTPDVPAGAFMPSKRPALTLASFTVAGGNIGCSLSSGGVHCAVLNKSWTAPRQPSNCVASWGNAINLLTKGDASFACGGPATPGHGKVVSAGSDVKVGQFTCQVRTFGVDCFAADRRGFLISRTGYTFY